MTWTLYMHLSLQICKIDCKFVFLMSELYSHNFPLVGVRCQSWVLSIIITSRGHILVTGSWVTSSCVRWHQTIPPKSHHFLIYLKFLNSPVPRVHVRMCLAACPVCDWECPLVPAYTPQSSPRQGELEGGRNHSWRWKDMEFFYFNYYFMEVFSYLCAAQSPATIGGTESCRGDTSLPPSAGLHFALLLQLLIL